MKCNWVNLLTIYGIIGGIDCVWRPLYSNAGSGVRTLAQVGAARVVQTIENLRSSSRLFFNLGPVIPYNPEADMNVVSISFVFVFYSTNYHFN